MEFTEFKIKAPAKINLSLHITGKRADNYHLLDSLVVFADIGDILHFSPAKKYSLSINGDYAETLKNKENIINKTVEKLCKKLPNISIILTKNLPIASGIGGGSSNAAATILGLSKIMDINDNMHDIALSLGADVPMCLNKKNCIVKGIGEKLEVVKLPRLYMVLVNPNIQISTPEIFKEYTKNSNYRSKQNYPDISKQNNLISFLKNTTNDLQPIATNLCPEINNILRLLNKENGCLLSRMSGSGSTCFGIFKDFKTSQIAKNNLEKKHTKWWIKKTITL